MSAGKENGIRAAIQARTTGAVPAGRFQNFPQFCSRLPALDGLVKEHVLQLFQGFDLRLKLLVIHLRHASVTFLLLVELGFGVSGRRAAFPKRPL